MYGKVFMKIVSIIIAIAGAWILIKSTTWGLYSASEYLRSVGGSMDSSQYGIVQGSFMASYRLLGTVLMGLGGLSFIFTKGAF